MADNYPASPSDDMSPGPDDVFSGDFTRGIVSDAFPATGEMDLLGIPDPAFGVRRAMDGQRRTTPVVVPGLTNNAWCASCESTTCGCSWRQGM